MRAPVITAGHDQFPEGGADFGICTLEQEEKALGRKDSSHWSVCGPPRRGYGGILETKTGVEQF